VPFFPLFFKECISSFSNICCTLAIVLILLYFFGYSPYHVIMVTNIKKEIIVYFDVAKTTTKTGELYRWVSPSEM